MKVQELQEQKVKTKSFSVPWPSAAQDAAGNQVAVPFWSSELLLRSFPGAGRAAMGFRAICEERVSFPINLFQSLPGVYDRGLCSKCLADVQMARCNCDLWWVALKPQVYRKLGYLQAEIDGHMKGSAENGADRAETVALLCSDARELNAGSICSPMYREDSFGSKRSHAIWGKAVRGLILSSITPWEMKAKEHGMTKGGWMRKGCQGF